MLTKKCEMKSNVVADTHTEKLTSKGKLKRTDIHAIVIKSKVIIVPSIGSCSVYITVYIVKKLAEINCDKHK